MHLFVFQVADELWSVEETKKVTTGTFQFCKAAPGGEQKNQVGVEAARLL